MSETKELTYAALITLNLPGQTQTTQVSVLLAPSDEVTVNGRAVPLRDCTLADLRRYADALEAEAWQAFQEITLLELQTDERVEVLVTLSDATPVPDWQQQVIVLPVPEAASEPPAAEAAPDAVRPDSVTEPAAPEVEVASEPEVAQPEPEADATPEPQLESLEETAVAPPAAEPAEAEPRVEVGEAIEEPETPVAAAETIIRPSRARVRVAGRQLPVGHPTWAAVDIIMDEPAFRQAQAHALSSMSREVAGVLVGPRPEKQPDGRYLVHVIDTIVAKHTVMQGASVTYTPESWRYLNDTLNERYPDETAVMVGWYHTHPGFGIFLSGMDLFIHQNFFTQIWHVAYVLDPQARTSGFFCWDRKRQDVKRYEFMWPSWAPHSW